MHTHARAHTLPVHFFTFLGACPPLLSLNPPTSPLGIFESMGYTFLRVSIEAGVGITARAHSAHLDSILIFQALFALATGLCALGLFFWQRSWVLAWDRGIKRARGMLLLFPTDVLAGVAEYLHTGSGGEGEK